MELMTSLREPGILEAQAGPSIFILRSAVKLPFREEDATMLCEWITLQGPRLALVGWHDAGRGDEMYRVTASSQVALKDK